MRYLRAPEVGLQADANSYPRNERFFMNGSTALATAREKSSIRWQPHYPALIAFVWQHRYATLAQIHRRFSTIIKSRRTLSYQVRKLTAAGYLTHVPIRAVMPTHPFVYIATNKGMRLVATAIESRTGRPWSEGRGEERRAGRGYGLPFIQHELAITDVDIAMRELVENRADIQLVGHERRYHQPQKQLTYWQGSVQHTLRPDAGYHLVHQRHGRRWLDVCFLEYDRGTMRPQRVGEKLVAYRRWSESSDGLMYLRGLNRTHYGRLTGRPTFRLLLVAQSRPGEGRDVTRLARLVDEAAAFPRLFLKRLWLIESEALHQTVDNQVGVGDRTWLPAWQTIRLLASANTRRATGSQLARTPRYTLFPPAVAL